VTMLPEWELHAIRYASTERRVRTNFLHSDDMVDGPMDLDFFLWVAFDRSSGHLIVVDTGFNRQSSARRSRVQECDPQTALGALGHAIADVQDVVVTHLHYDHAGNFGAFPSAIFHLQAAEMEYATGTPMYDVKQNHFYEPDDICSAVRSLYAGRLRFHRGDGEIAPGVTVHHIGGHTVGLQIVRVHTARGWVVLASDAAHYFANRALRNPFPAVHDVDEMMRGYDRLDELAASAEHIIPGHDPEVLRIYPRLQNTERLDIAILHQSPVAVPRQPIFTAA
jgi:glyoxylase-like metal-dependent hydrolase (beta-lactamase superfamily II)